MRHPVVVRAALVVGLAMIASAYASTQARLEIRAVKTASLTSQQFLLGDFNQNPVTIAGELRLPVCDPRYSPCPEATATPRKLPAVVLIHGSGGIIPYHERWVSEINSLGIATLLLDSFSSRGIANLTTNQSALSFETMILDAYRALDVLAKDPRIDSTRIAVMGWSRGAVAAVYSSSARFTRMYAPARLRFAAHLGLYTPCRYEYRDDDKTTGTPIRLFHGAADDITPSAVCRSYAARVKASGGDVTLTEYPEAYHLFDNWMQGPPGVQDPQQQNQRNCLLVEDQQGLLRNAKSNQLFDINTDPCVVRGGTRGFNEAAAVAVTSDVKRVLATVLDVKR